MTLRRVRCLAAGGIFEGAQWGWIWGVCGGKLQIGSAAARMKKCCCRDTASSNKTGNGTADPWAAEGVVRDVDLPRSWRTHAPLTVGPWYLWLPCISSSASADSTNHRSYSTVYLLLKTSPVYVDPCRCYSRIYCFLLPSTLQSPSNAPC